MKRWMMLVVALIIVSLVAIVLPIVMAVSAS